MKIENSKLTDENNKNLRIIESFLTESAKNVGEYLLGKSNNNYNNNIDSSNGNGLRKNQMEEGSK